ncbi:MAG: transcriptional regulator [Deltaproteobacteria bacterium]|nr:transcriptional regulator [Deltaproteobacteria bacterium]MBW2071479.1 transcriptional regulator [Deltaproteobacteria bacterium]
MGTIRQQMGALLADKEMTARELSQAMGIPEKEVYQHLPHVARSAAAQNMRLMVQPVRCLACGYVFRKRQRYNRPGRCPRCRKTHLEEPRYRLCSL